jgi:hypothetical protein
MASVAGQDGNAGSGVELGFEFKVIQGELAYGFGVDPDEAPEIFVLPAEPLYGLVGVFAAAGGPDPLRGGSLVVRSLAEVLYQVPVVAVEGGVAGCPAPARQQSRWPCGRFRWPGRGHVP